MDAHWASAGVSTLQRLGRRLLLAAAFLVLLLPALAKAGFDEGVAAYERGDYRTAFREFFRLALAGDPSAQFYLGVMYDYGEGVPQNYAGAVYWYRRAGDQGHAKAQFNLGVLYHFRMGVPQNHAEAVRWYRLAAEQGLAQAQAFLGAMYADGEGVPQHDVQAYMWLNLAAAGETDGELRDKLAEARDRVAARLSPAQRAQAQKMARNWRPTVAARSEGGASAVGGAQRNEPPASRVERETRDLQEEVRRLQARLRIKLVQERLAELGYDPGPVDGIVGPRTRAAIREFQADVGLPVDGHVSDGLHEALVDAGALDDAGSRGQRAAAPPAPAEGRPDGAGTDPFDAFPRADAPGEGRLDGAGTGFAVSEDGQLVTNHHVVEECAEVRVRPAGKDAVAAVVVASDANNDLALLEAPVHLPAAATLDDRGIRAGDSVVAVGFPLHGLLASEANVTTGTVSALAGVGNDTRYFQMTVPVQAGNSGGPLLDLGGRVVGVVVGKLDALRVASVTGDLPQNVNFAIKAGVVRSFLDASGAGDLAPDPRADALHPIPRNPAAVGAEAKAFTVLVECWG